MRSKLERKKDAMGKVLSNKDCLFLETGKKETYVKVETAMQNVDLYSKQSRMMSDLVKLKVNLTNQDLSGIM